MARKSITMSATQAQAKSDRLLDEIARFGTTVTITRLGKPLVDLVPHDPKRKIASPAKGKRSPLRA